MRSVTNHLALLLGSSLAISTVVELAFAQAGSEGNAPAAFGQIQRLAAPSLADDSLYEVSAYPRYAPELSEGEGRAETASFCGSCHSTRYITMQPPLPPATWEVEVTKMRKTFGATIPDASAAVILKYLQTHYTPETRKE